MANDRDDVMDAVLEAWDRNNTIMLNLLRAVPEGALDARATPSSPTVAQQFMHLHHERLISVSEEAAEYAESVPEAEWAAEGDPQRIAALLVESAGVVGRAARGRVMAGQALDRNFGHPLLMVQFLLWHEGYHHGQIKLALKISGKPISDDEAGPLTWDVWRHRTTR
jgi:uncharacterized damage-inducible protein DinB